MPSVPSGLTGIARGWPAQPVSPHERDLGDGDHRAVAGDGHARVGEAVADHRGLGERAAVRADRVDDRLGSLERARLALEDEQRAAVGQDGERLGRAGVDAELAEPEVLHRADQPAVGVDRQGAHAVRDGAARRGN